ncbi:MAG TPA: glycosyltransferase family 39 protein [Acidimicrobiales bacterium]|nr:glycosyltransferase family 39 protein [Acidimicrobiales bacterium]
MTAVLEAPPAPPEAPAPTPRPGPLRRFARGRPGDPAWVRPALLGLLAATAALYLWGLGASGWANAYYSAAVQAASSSWKAFFFGSTDAANFITVDKAPLFLWPMALSARLFGVNSWSILVPQALEGVAAVGVLYLAVRRWFGPAAGLAAGAVMALTPVATLMFRFNNPDALLVLLLTAGAYAVTRSLEKGSTGWIVLAGSLVGWAFLAKMLQALLVVPAFGLVYLIAAPVALRRRLWQLVLAGAALVASAGWWVAAVSLWPASSRPYIGGSQTNSVLELIFGYNGFGRLTGNENGSVGGGPAGTSGRWGPTGVLRLFNADYGGQASWLVPAALVFLVALLVVTVRRPRTDRTRAAALLWGGWLVVTGLAISLGEGIIHTYYTVALAPAVGALVAIGGAVLWRHRDHLAARLTLAGTVVLTGWWAFVLLGRTPGWHPELRWFVLGGAVAAASAVLVGPWTRPAAVATVVGATLAVGLAGPAAYSLATAATDHSGALPVAGPAAAARLGGPGGGPGRPPAGQGGFNRFAPPAGANAFGPPPGLFAAGPPAGSGGPGGILGASTVSGELADALRAGTGGYTWAAATVSANQAAGYQLASGEPVMAIGGFNGTDPAPTLAQFQQLVSEGRIHWFIAGGRGGGPGGGASTSSAITTWVESTFTSTTVGGVTLYDLS